MSNLPTEGVELIKQFESCRLEGYPDPLTGNKPITIGWGSTKNLQGNDWCLGESITQADADTLLTTQLKQKFLPTLSRTIPYWDEMSENQQGALLCFAYNLGADFYGNENFQTITRNLKNKDWDEVPDTLLRYCNPGSRVEEGLRRRRKAEGDLWMKK